MHFLLAFSFKVCYISKITTATYEGTHAYNYKKTHK